MRDFKTAQRSAAWKEGYAQFQGSNRPTERNPHPEGSPEHSEHHDGFLSAYLEDAEQFALRNRYN